MDTIQIERLKGLLESRLEDLSGGVRSRDTIAVEKTADAMDEAQLAEQRDLAIRILDRDFAEMRLVEQALARIEEETYGRCLRCDEAIGWKRLSVAPHAAFCIPCQEKADEEDKFSVANGLASVLAQ
jgi:DnaK suppressor protein